MTIFRTTPGMPILCLARQTLRNAAGPLAWRRSLLTALLLCSLVGCGSHETNDDAETRPVLTHPSLVVRHDLPRPRIDATLTTKIDAAKLERAIHAAADYMMRSCDEHGRFKYLVNLNPAVTIPPSYSIVRHAGAMYALAAYNRWQPSEKARQAMQRAGGYIERNALRPMPTQENLLGIWSVKNKRDVSSMAIAEAQTEDDSSSQNEPDEMPLDAQIVPIVRLGNLGLGLVALAGLHRAVPEAMPLETPQGVGRFILFMRKGDGAFYPTYDPEDNGLNDKWYCEYYPGEAILGLVTLYEIDPDSKWLQAAADGIYAMAWQRRTEAHPPADHWALLATARLFAATDKDSIRFPRDLWRRHGESICRGILADYNAGGEPKRLGDLSGAGYLCRTSCRLEGLLAARTFLQDDDLSRRISLAAAEGIAFLLDAQIQGGPCDGAFPCLAPNPEVAPIASTDRETTEVRIDYVQHALCAMLQYANLVGLRPAAEQPEKK